MLLHSCHRIRPGVPAGAEIRTCQDQEDFDLLSERRSPWMRTRFERERAAFFQRACRKRVAALRAVDEMNVIRIDR